ncbi:MAG: carbon-nitrogen hydrolase [Balneolaceae bacterium]|nr:carbon-nitrogen hydrolase [Balneolaceae bacterium]
MEKRNVQVALIQMSCSPNPEENMDKVEREIRVAAEHGAQIVCLQELFRSLYFCDVEDYDNFALAESIPGPSTNRFSELAKELGVVIIASLFEKRTAGIYHNTTAVLDADGSYLGKYRKMHIPDDPGYFEKFYFTPGDLGYKVFETKFAKVGVLICWDQWYPEAARLTAMKGAELLVYPTAIGWHQDQDDQTNEEQLNAWQTIQKSHSVANGIPVISVNRTGNEGEMKFWGNSFVTNSFGYVTYQAPSSEEVTKVLEINLNESDEKRTHWPFFRDRRIDSYAPITKRFLDDDESN